MSRISDFFSVVSREDYLKVARALERDHQRLVDEQQSNRLLRDTVASQKALIETLSRGDVQDLVRRHDALLEEVTQVRVALGRAVTLQGLTETSPVALLVDAIVRDHDELESRIEAVLMLLADRPNAVSPRDIERILRGGPRVPDTIEGIG